MLYSEISEKYDEMHELKKQLEDLQLYNECQKNVVMDDKRTQFPENIPISVKKKVARNAAKKATKTIKELFDQRLV